MSARPRIAALLLALALPGAALAQTGPELALRHGFPEAGGSVRLLVEGLQPDDAVVVQLHEPGLAPPSILEDLSAVWAADVTGSLATWVPTADAFGLLDVVVQLDDPADVGRLAHLTFDAGGGRTAEVRLLVQAPMLLVATASGVERVDLRDGTLLAPAVPAAGGLADAALSADGLQLHVLRDDGSLERRSAAEWSGPALAVDSYDTSGDDLARARDLGALFVVESPAGAPFAPAGRLAFPDGERMSLSPMGQSVSGRRWALHPDGGSAFVAEDDLLVREVDLVTRQGWRPFPVGAPGDDAIADLVVQGDRLLVATRRSGGLSGSLSVLDLVTGQLSTELLAVDPARLLVVDEHHALVVPASGARVLEVLVDGALTSGARTPVLLDAAAVPGGALLLGRDADGSHPLLRWSAADNLVVPLGFSAPTGGRLYTAGHDVAVLIADDGAVWRVLVDEARLEPVGVVAEPGSRAVVLP